MERGGLAQPLRKINMNKPMMEKKRRARINACLTQLKTMVLQEMSRDNCSRISYSKLEKADILEMTVQYLRNLQRQQMINAASLDAGVIEKYMSGYTECTNEVFRYINLMDGVDQESKQRLMGHLSSGVQTLTATKLMSTAESIKQKQAGRIKAFDEVDQQISNLNQMLAEGQQTKAEPQIMHQQQQHSGANNDTRTLSSPSGSPADINNNNSSTAARHHNLTTPATLSSESLSRLSLLSMSPDASAATPQPALATPVINILPHNTQPLLQPRTATSSVASSIDYGVSPKDFDSVDSGICDRVDDYCHLSSGSSSPSASFSDDDRKLDDVMEPLHHQHLPHQGRVAAAAAQDNDPMWRPW